MSFCTEIKDNTKEISNVDRAISQNSALYFFRSTPFSEHSEFNYNGALTSEFFFNNLFSKVGKYETYISEIVDAIENKHNKSVIIIGNQGCGKTTFLHGLKRELKAPREFLILDFDKNTSNPKLKEYIEIFSSYFHNLIYKDYQAENTVNKMFYNIFQAIMTASTTFSADSDISRI